MTLTSAACPLTDVIEDQTKVALGTLVDDGADQLGMDAPVGSGQDHRRRPRAAARARASTSETFVSGADPLAILPP